MVYVVAQEVGDIVEHYIGWNMWDFGGIPVTIEN